MNNIIVIKNIYFNKYIKSSNSLMNKKSYEIKMYTISTN